MGPKQKNITKNNKGANNNNKHGNKESYLADDQNFQSFSTQLAKLGLELRDITGDGNCCFRALSDQMEGNERQHLEYRKRVCQYMRQNREEFEPFVAALIDDDNEQNNENIKKSSSNKKLDAFEKYIKNLEQPGTYADNGCLVAFARLYQVDINIHQLNLPIWTINGSFSRKLNQQVRQLHLSYHNGEHYSSIRPLGDRTNTPTNITFNDSLTYAQISNTKSSSSSSTNNSSSLKSKSKKSIQDSANSAASHTSNTSNYKYELDCYSNNNFYYDDHATNESSHQYYDDNSTSDHDYSILTDNNNSHTDLVSKNLSVDQIINVTNCHDVNLIMKKLNENKNDVEMTIMSLLSHMQIGNKPSNTNGQREEGDDDDESDDDSNENKNLNDVVNCENSQTINTGEKSSSSSRKNTKKSKTDKKKEKKDRQMERQRIKVLEQREKESYESSSSNKIKQKQIIDQNELAENHQQQIDGQANVEYNILLNNVNIKSI